MNPPNYLNYKSKDPICSNCKHGEFNCLKPNWRDEDYICNKYKYEVIRDYTCDDFKFKRRIK